MLKVTSISQFFKRLSQSEKTLLTAACAALLLVLFDLGIISPIIHKISSLNKEISQKQAAIARDLHIYALKDKILEEAKKYETFLEKGETDEEEMTVLLKEIENIASKSSLYIVEMKPAGTKEERDGAKRFVVNLTCEGEMEQIAGFMYSIENSKMLLGIEKYQINPKSKDSAIAQCSMVISKSVIKDL